MNAATPFLLLALAAFAVAAGARSLWLRGALDGIAAWWREASRTTRAAALALLVAAFACGTDKTPGDGLRALPRLAASLCTNAFTEAERQTGYAVSSISTNEAHDFAMPTNAVLAERIAIRGAHRDGFWLNDTFTNRTALAGLEPENPVWIHTDGTVSARTPAPELPIAALPGIPALSNATVYAPLQSSYGFLPASLWETLGTSRVWTAVSPLGSRVVTWEGARLDRDHTKPVSFQAEFSRDGGVSYRYDHLPTNGVAIGLFRHGADSFTYDSLTQFSRALPAVAAGQYVPPPFVTVIARTFDNEDNVVYESASTAAIPQYVKVTWSAAAVEELRQPIVFNFKGTETIPATNETLFAGCTASGILAALSEVAGNMQALYPEGCNIVVVGPDRDVPQPHKTVEIRPGLNYNATGNYFTNDLGTTPGEHCHERNDSPLGTSGVYVEAFRTSIHGQFGSFIDALHSSKGVDTKNNWRNIPLPLSSAQLAQYISNVAVHETCHAMGLVPETSANYLGHNDCRCGGHIMDPGSSRYVPMHLGYTLFFRLGWMPNNIRYLKFVLP